MFSFICRKTPRECDLTFEFTIPVRTNTRQLEHKNQYAIASDYCESLLFTYAIAAPYQNDILRKLK